MNAEQKQRAKDLLQQYASYTNPRLLMLVDMAALLQELIDADEKSKYSVLAAPSVPDGKVGFSMYFDREQWGAIIDGLGFEIERSEQRKAANCESTSNVRADMCKEIILAINRVSDTAFTAQLLPEPPADLVRDAERWLSQRDLELLVTFGMQADDCDADGHTLSKEQTRRLCELGVLRNVGFGRSEMTAFGCVLFDQHWEQSRSLPLRTHAEYAALAAEKGGAE